MKPIIDFIRPSIAGLLACAFLAFILSYDNHWPGIGVWPTARVSIEALVVVALGIFLIARSSSKAATNRTLTLVSALLATLAVLHYVDVTVSGLFGRPLNLFWDGRHLPQLLKMAAASSPSWLIALAVVGVPCALIALYFTCCWALRVVCTAALATGAGRRFAAGLASAAGLAGAAATLGPSALSEAVVTPLTLTYGKQLLFVAAVFTPGASDRLLPTSPKFSGDLSALQGVDVLIVFSESYGAATFDDPELRVALQAARSALQQAVSATGRHAASAFVESPTFGGGSWLAHAALLSGVDMREPDHHALLLASKRSTLIKHFQSNGYRSVALMPGLRADWPEGAYYGFDQIYDARALDYSGPSFGFWRIPDQFSLARLHREELISRGGVPRLIVFPTITSHLPFDPVPPLAPDWSFLRAGELNASFSGTLDAAAVERAIARQSDWLALREPYLRSMDYSLRWVSGYLRESAPRDLLTIIIGDHQPAATVVGRDADRAVPIHVISHSPELIQRFVNAGFASGLLPRRPALGHMHELTATLVEIFGGAAQPRVDIPGARPGG